MPSSALSRRPVSDSAMMLLRALAWLRVTSAIVAAVGRAVVCRCLACPAARRPGPRGAPGTGAVRQRSTCCLTTVSVGLALGGRSGLWQFVYWLPGFNFIREPSRFMVLGLLGVAVLAGVGFDRLTARLAPSRRRLAAVVAGGLLVAEFSAIPFKATRTGSISPPPIGGWPASRSHSRLRRSRSPESERYHSNYMLHSMAHWQKTVHGFSGIRPALHDELYRQLESFPSEESVRHLAQLGVTYVIVHSSWFPPEERG